MVDPIMSLDILGVLQVRLSSSRLPGKALNPILGRPMLAIQAERVRRARRIDRWIIATSGEPSDDPLAELAAGIGLDCFRGSLADVLDRHYRVVQRYRPKHLLRVGGDCPLADWRILDRLVDLHLAGGYDFSSNAYPPTWPDGMDAEILTSPLIESLWAETELPSEREHISPYVAERHRDRYRIGNLSHSEDLQGLRLTVDEPADFEVVAAIITALYPTDPDFGFDDVMAFVRAHPDLMARNRHFIRNAGRAPSLAADQAYPQRKARQP